jgi:hypothetical protein
MEQYVSLSTNIIPRPPGLSRYASNAHSREDLEVDLIRDVEQ